MAEPMPTVAEKLSLIVSPPQPANAAIAMPGQDLERLCVAGFD
jgi:hypothetical protein